LNQILADHCGKSLEEMQVATDRDNFMNAQEAVEFGIVDQALGLE
jgi:ATP-dependent Clp protease protease subunit